MRIYDKLRYTTPILSKSVQSLQTIHISYTLGGNKKNQQNIFLKGNLKITIKI